MPRFQETRVTVLAAGGQILPAAEKRVGIIWPSPPTNRYTITTIPTPVIDVGFNQYPATQPWDLTALLYGQITSKAWFGISAVADQVIVIGEIYE